MKARCSGCRFSAVPSPSMVLIFLPRACTANIRQERTASPSRMMVQVPQTPCSQPMCVPVLPQSSRMASTSVLRGSTRTKWSRPLMLSVRLTTSSIWLGLLGGASDARQDVLELGEDALLQLLAVAHHHRESVAPAERPAGI